MTDTTDTGGSAELTDETLLPTEGEGAADGANSGSDPAAGAEGEGDGQPAKPKQTAQERIDEVTRARREAERDAEYWKAKALQGPVTEKPAAAAPEAQGPAKPDPADFEDGTFDPAYIDALVDWRTSQALEKHTERTNQRTAAQREAEAFQEREQAAIADATKFPDYQKIVVEGAERNAWSCTPEMAEAIRTSDTGPQVAYHLAKNPDESRRIAALSPIAQIRELGRLEERFAVAPTPPAKTATGAPDPIPHARGTGGRFQVDPATDDFAAFERQYGGK